MVGPALLSSNTQPSCSLSCKPTNLTSCGPLPTSNSHVDPGQSQLLPDLSGGPEHRKASSPGPNLHLKEGHGGPAHPISGTDITWNFKYRVWPSPDLLNLRPGAPTLM